MPLRPWRRLIRPRAWTVVRQLVGRDELLADRAENALIGRAGEIDQLLPLDESVERDQKPIDAKRDRASHVLVLGREVVFAEVWDGIEQLAVANVEEAIGVEQPRRGVAIRGGDDDADDRLVVDVERRLERVRQQAKAERFVGGVALAVRRA